MSQNTIKEGGGGSDTVRQQRSADIQQQSKLQPSPLDDKHSAADVKTIKSSDIKQRAVEHTRTPIGFNGATSDGGSRSDRSTIPKNQAFSTIPSNKVGIASLMNQPTAAYGPQADGGYYEVVTTNRRAPNRESYCTLNSQNINAPELQLFDIRSQRLQHIYNEEKEELERNLMDVSKIFDSRTFKYEALIAFWLSIHLERLEIAQLVYEQDTILEKILQNLRRTSKESQQKNKRINAGATVDGGESNSDKKYKQLNVTLKPTLRDGGQTSDRGGRKNKNNQDNDEQIVRGLNSIEELKEIKELLKTPIGATFNTNVLRIALNMQEERIASILIAYYTVRIDEEMILRAVKTAQLDFLYCVYAYNRNFQEIMQTPDEFKSNSGGAAVSDNLSELKTKYKVFTFDYLIKHLIDYGEDQVEARVRQMAQWKLRTTENILKSLLKHHMDIVANEVAMFYIDNADRDLLLYALQNFNEIFLKYALRNSIIGSNMMVQPYVIEQILKIFARGSRSELLLNVMLFSDFTRWEQFNLRKLLNMLKEIVSEEHEQNRILLCYNPILAIALGCEFLDKIAENKNIFKHECNIVKGKLMNLGEFIIDNTEDEKIEKVFLDADFKDRTVLKIATMNEFAPLCASDKVNVLLQEIWEGKKTYECDGQISDFSIIDYLATSRVQKVKGKKLTFKELITQNFVVDIDDQKYWFQYKFRHHSISYFFKKDFISGLGMVILFQYINFVYLSLFNKQDFVGFTPDAQYVIAQDKIDEYNKVNYFGTIFSATLVLHLISKAVFNVFAEVKMPLDKWSMIDLLCSLFNIVCFNMIGKTQPETIIDRKKKESLDYYVIAVVIVSWLRFFGYFLVVRSVSKLINTLIRMISDAVSFILIMTSYLLLMSTIFTTLFQSAMPDQYPDISTSLRTLYDAMLGAYSYTDEESYMVSNSVLTMIHVFISNIFLLNFLVAILSTVYEVMMEHGEFSFKSNKYEFIEKYSIAMLDQNGYAELVIHPPPINIFTLFILPWIVRKSWMKKAADCFSKFMFWLENVFYLLVFMTYEILLFPLIYAKVALTIGFLSNWQRLIPLLLFWLCIGPLVLIFQMAKDTFFFVKILCDYMDEEDQFKEKEEEDFRQDKIVIYNEVVDVMRSISYIFRKKMLEAKLKRQALGEIFAGDIEEQQQFLLFGDSSSNPALMDNSKTSLTMEKSLIIEAWGRYRPSSKDNSPRANQMLNKGANKRDIQVIYGEAFMKRLITGVKQKTYLSKAERLNGGAEGGKNEVKMQEQLNSLLMSNKGKNEQNNDDEDEEFTDRIGDDLDDDSALVNIPEEEVQLIEDFLDKFVFVSDSSTSREQVDLNLALKALPLKVDETNIYRIDLMNFNLVQRSLIAFQNDQQDELFEFYDNRNRQRLRKITKRATDNEAYTEDVKTLANLCLAGFGRLIKLLGTQGISNANLPEIIGNRSTAGPGGNTGKSKGDEKSQHSGSKNHPFSKVVPI